jgi:predicted AAA+ superfamily ATPase
METKRKVENTTQSQTNIWQDILQEAMSKKDLDESNVFIFGDRNVGKRTLIKIINKELLQKNDFEGKNSLINQKRKS